MKFDCNTYFMGESKYYMLLLWSPFLQMLWPVTWLFLICIFKYDLIYIYNYR